MSAGLQARDHRAIFGDRGHNLGDAQALENLARNIGGGTRDAAIGGDGGKGRFVRNGDADKTLRLEVFKLIGGGRQRGNQEGRNQKVMFHGSLHC